jgi:hypothetical protein
MVKHWEKLSLLLREPAAPLDNDVCEHPEEGHCPL